MSRTKKGKKSSGSEYWGKRPIGWTDSGTKGKRTGIKKERAVNKRNLFKELMVGVKEMKKSRA